MLRGIGPKLAAAIVRERDEHGRYLSVDDLKRVYGIKATIIAKLKSHLAVSP